MFSTRATSTPEMAERRTWPRPRPWHVLGLIAAASAFYAVMAFRWSQEDPGRGLVRQLSSWDDLEREAAARELGHFTPRERRAIEPLTQALFDTDAHLRALAARGLAWIVKAGDPEVSKVRALLLAAIRDRDRDARLAILSALTGFGANPEMVVPPLVELARDDHETIRAEAVQLLGPFARENGQAREALLHAALGDVDPEPRWKAVVGLGAALFSPGPAPEPLRRTIAGVLLGAADDDEPVVRAQAILALGRLGGELGEVFPRVLKALVDDSSVEVRHNAARWLGVAKTPALRMATLLPVLDRILSDPEPRIRLEIAQGLASGWYGLEAEDALPSLLASAEDPDHQARMALDRAIEAIDQVALDFRTRLLPEAIAELGDPDPAARVRAAARLGGFGPRAAKAVPTLVQGLGDREADVRLASAEAMGHLGPEAAVAAPTLILLAGSDPDDRVRRAARRSRSTLLQDDGLADRCP